MTPEQIAAEAARRAAEEARRARIRAIISQLSSVNNGIINLSKSTSDLKENIKNNILIDNKGLEEDKMSDIINNINEASNSITNVINGLYGLL